MTIIARGDEFNIYECDSPECDYLAKVPIRGTLADGFYIDLLHTDQITNTFLERKVWFHTSDCLMEAMSHPLSFLSPPIIPAKKEL